MLIPRHCGGLYMYVYTSQPRQRQISRYDGERELAERVVKSYGRIYADGRHYSDDMSLASHCPVAWGRSSHAMTH